MGRYGAPVQPQVVVQPGVGVPGGKGEVPGAPLGVESQGQGHGLQQSGLAAAVFPHQKGDGLAQLQQAQPSNGGDALQIGVLPGKAAAGALYGVEIHIVPPCEKSTPNRSAFSLYRSVRPPAVCLRGPPKRSLMVSPRSKRVPPRVSIPPGFRAHQARARLACGGVPKEAMLFHRAPNACRPVCLSHQAFAPLGAYATCPRRHPKKKPCGFTESQTRAAPCVYLTRLSRPLGACANCPRGHPKKKPCGFTAPQTRAAPLSIPPGNRAHQARARLGCSVTLPIRGGGRQWDSGWRP